MDRNPARSSCRRFLLSALLLSVLAGCGESAKEGAATEGAPTWKARHAAWSSEGGVRFEGSDGSADDAAYEATYRVEDALKHRAHSVRRSGDGFDDRSVMIHVDSPHPALGLAAEAMMRELAQRPGVEWIRCRTDAAIPGPEEPRPAFDVFLGFHEPPGIEQEADTQRLETRIRCLAGSLDRLYRSGANELSMPWRWSAILNHTSDTTVTACRGVSAPRWRRAGEDIGRKLGQALRAQLDQWARDIELPPESPRGLTPEFVPPPKLSLPEGLELRLRTSRASPLASNQSLWRVIGTPPLEPRLEALIQTLERDGWKTRTTRDPADPFRNLFLVREHEWLRFEPDRDPFLESPGPIQSGLLAYGQAISDAVLKSHLAAVDFDEIDPRWLLVHRRYLDASQSERLLRQLERQPLSDWRSVLEILGPLQARHGHAEDLAATMKQARCLAWVAGETPLLARRWRQQARQWKVDVRELEEIPTRGSDFEDIGAVRFEPGTPLELTVGLRERLLIVTGPEVDPQLMLLRVEPRPRKMFGTDPYALYRREAHRSGSCVGYRTLEGKAVLPVGLSGQTVRLDATAEQISENPLRFRIRVQKAR